MNGGRTVHLLDCASETNRNLCANIREFRAHYDQKLADIRYESDGSHAQLTAFDSRSEVSCNSLRVAMSFLRRIEAHRYR